MPFTDANLEELKRVLKPESPEWALLARLEAAEAYAKAARSGREAYFPQLYAAWLTASGRGQA